MRDDGKTQQEIADTLGWSREKVRDYVAVFSKVGADILEIAKKYQEGRAPQNGTNAPIFNFTEGWFRDVGIYELWLSCQTQEEIAAKLNLDQTVISRKLNMQMGRLSEMHNEPPESLRIYLSTFSNRLSFPATAIFISVPFSISMAWQILAGSVM